MSSSSILAIVLGALSLVFLVGSKLLSVIEWLWRWNADRRISNTDKEINKNKEDLNAIHNENVTNIDAYERAKRDAGSGKK